MVLNNHTVQLQEFLQRPQGQRNLMVRDHILRINTKDSTKVDQECILLKQVMDLLVKDMDLQIHHNNRKDIRQTLTMALL